MKIIAKIFGIMFGFMMVIWGIMSIFLKDLTYSTLLWMLSLNFIISSIGSIFTYGEKKDLGLIDKWTLIGSVVSFAFGIILVNVNILQINYFEFYIYMFPIWLIALCIAKIGKSIFIFRINRILNKQTKTSKRWWLILSIGIVLGLVGILSFVDIIISFIPINYMLGIGIFIAGLDLLISQFEE